VRLTVLSLLAGGLFAGVEQSGCSRRIGTGGRGQYLVAKSCVVWDKEWDLPA